jgi:GNAT superfamily N-acetyltransferase
MTQAEIADIAGILKLLLKPQDVAIAEHQGEAAAFALIFPNINEAIADLGGRLAPFGWAKLLWRLKVKGTRTARMPLMGVRRAFQGSPLGAALALSVIEATRSYHHGLGTEEAELSWILDRNEQVKHIIDLVGAHPYKRYRIYERRLP